MQTAPRIELHTNLGSFQVELYTAHAPKTCQNFMELTRRSYYNNTKASLTLLPQLKKQQHAVWAACGSLTGLLRALALLLSAA